MTKVENKKENLMRCICESCPSYSECTKGEMQGLFCARAKSLCGFDKKGCVCGNCPLTEEFRLTGGYYCESGAV
ncbi:hypothetical protein A2331_05870 [Candidatus Falkowbacteria bacterium RIFOXYB2_FULL_34_18]|uniref:DUF2769 domain-containing protein n=1 Tax=Candidatus Falkowbacteria bacterium RIFOXYD2_FULL_34_120 TaxID=1798007 RepID=A0A1F5TLY7_9BACT|nr:MAG: hypothetical protein A2331_05870 [Candidatus Falkowbacteria bacterium RIFOXYB2_FULL_34_18]OGF29172.1 MAG: hypothetical protein A2500_05815 [Candidatus Falkowbacteria bacterium RIFOXYC12_FULL_34_55]OGF36978.1 MAG: hypothetical protein A2466_07195 [Candidatus Falkowbacteria bacterium RIFOXYC2_FULL_34_220]OGF38694.1 MAG: hypothetical protein A2515_01480 [Candidatus Falkowbacteria bacterium RIFOXYD12_FULL_34_57]OGF39928.1 MAG: hypothetical protein A2531_01735 [Candidatus Falkowbacteria bact